MNDAETEKPLGVSPMRRIVDPIGFLLTEGFHLLGLFAIGGAAVWAAMKAIFEVTVRRHASIEDLLLLFIYLEIGSMVGIHLPHQSHAGSLPALCWHNRAHGTYDGYVQKEAVPDIGILILAGATLILSLAVLTIRYVSARFSDKAST